MAKLNLAKVKWWLESAAPGEEIVYRRGPSTFAADDKPEIAKAFWQLYEQGAVTLTQRKVEDGHYDYIATRC